MYIACFSVDRMEEERQLQQQQKSWSENVLLSPLTNFVTSHRSGDETEVVYDGWRSFSTPSPCQINSLELFMTCVSSVPALDFFPSVAGVTFAMSDFELKTIPCHHWIIINPFTVPACNISGLKDAVTRLQTVYFPVLEHICFHWYAFLWKSFHVPLRKRRQKGLKVSDFALLLVVFKWHSSEGVKRELFFASRGPLNVEVIPYVLYKNGGQNASPM